MSDIQNLTASLDLKQNLNIYAACKQSDNLKLILLVYDKSIQANLTNYTVRMKAMKADKIPLIQEHTGITINSNVVTIIADEQLTTTSGKTLIELQFINSTTGEKKATFNLVLVVSPSTFEIDRKISTATYTLLEELENKLDQATNYFKNVENFQTAHPDLLDLDNRVTQNTAELSENTQNIATNTTNITNHVADLVTDSDGVHGLKISKGYFTPYWEGETTVGAPAYTQQKGYYTIIDKTLHFQIYILWQHLGGAVGKMRLRGFPYACKNEAFRINTFSLLSNSFKYDAYTNLVASMDNGLNYAIFTKQGGTNVNLASVIDTDISTTGWIILNGSYEID